MASEQFEAFMRMAHTTNGGIPEASFFAQLATAEALGRIADSLNEHVELIRELLTIATKELEPGPLPCNEMGGGSAGLDTAGDFAMHCSYVDGHDGPHSYEETYCFCGEVLEAGLCPNGHDPVTCCKEDDNAQPD